MKGRANWAELMFSTGKTKIPVVSEHPILTNQAICPTLTLLLTAKQTEERALNLSEL